MKTLAIMEDFQGRTWKLIFDDETWAHEFADRMDLEIVHLGSITESEAEKIEEIEY